MLRVHRITSWMINEVVAREDEFMKYVGIRTKGNDNSYMFWPSDLGASWLHVVDFPCNTARLGSQTPQDKIPKISNAPVRNFILTLMVRRGFPVTCRGVWLPLLLYFVLTGHDGTRTPETQSDKATETYLGSIIASRGPALAPAAENQEEKKRHRIPLAAHIDHVFETTLFNVFFNV